MKNKPFKLNSNEEKNGDLIKTKINLDIDL
jgi:hypothetical protein